MSKPKNASKDAPSQDVAAGAETSAELPEDFTPPMGSEGQSKESESSEEAKEDSEALGQEGEEQAVKPADVLEADAASEEEGLPATEDAESKEEPKKYVVLSRLKCDGTVYEAGAEFTNVRRVSEMLEVGVIKLT